MQPYLTNNEILSVHLFFCCCCCHVPASILTSGIRHAASFLSWSYCIQKSDGIGLYQTSRAFICFQRLYPNTGQISSAYFSWKASWLRRSSDKHRCWTEVLAGRQRRSSIKAKIRESRALRPTGFGGKSSRSGTCGGGDETLSLMAETAAHTMISCERFNCQMVAKGGILITEI